MSLIPWFAGEARRRTPVLTRVWSPGYQGTSGPRARWIVYLLDLLGEGAILQGSGKYQFQRLIQARVRAVRIAGSPLNYGGNCLRTGEAVLALLS